ncbi:MAG: DUF2341 domain-containing protein, partial [Verrucomicrobiota bacterium]
SRLNLTEGEPVCVWPNLVPNEFSAAQNALADQPTFSTNGINGQPAVHFVNDVLFQDDFVALFAGNEATLFVVAQIDAPQNYNLFTTRANNPQWREGVANNARMGTFRVNRIGVGGNLMPDFGSQLFAIESGTADWALWLNGRSTITQAPDFDAGGGFLNAIGGRTQDNGQRLNGDIAEILIYNRILTSDEHQRIGDYLESKYGLDTDYRHPEAAEVETFPATSVTANDAVLNGALTATGGSATAVSVYWGTSDGGTNPSAWDVQINLGSPATGVLSQALGSLSENTVYYYRFSASNNFATVWGEPSQSFITDLARTNFSRRLKVQFCGYDRAETLTNFPVLIRLSTNLQGFSYADFTSPLGHDLRVADADATNQLDFQIESWNTNGESFVWVRVPFLSTADQCIWLFWGHTNVVLPPSNTNGAPWSSDHLGVWQMAEVDATDSTSSRNDGTAMGAVTPATGQLDGANEFDRNVDFIAVPDRSEFTLSGDYSVSAWIRSDPAGNVHEGFVGTYNGAGFI